MQSHLALRCRTSAWMVTALCCASNSCSRLSASFVANCLAVSIARDVRCLAELSASNFLRRDFNSSCCALRNRRSAASASSVSSGTSFFRVSSSGLTREKRPFPMSDNNFVGDRKFIYEVWRHGFRFVSFRSLSLRLSALLLVIRRGVGGQRNSGTS